MVRAGLSMASSQKTGLILNRKLGYEKFIDDANKWQVLTELNKEEDWVDGSYICTVFLWSQKIGSLTNLGKEEIDYYSKK